MSRGCCLKIENNGGLLSKTDEDIDGPADQEGEFYSLGTSGGPSDMSLVPDDTRRDPPCPVVKPERLMIGKYRYSILSVTGPDKNNETQFIPN